MLTFSEPGSSPLTRGKPRAVAAGLTGGGLIPAHAGKTTTVVTRGLPWWAHPRSRGENPTSTPTYLRLAGSSPLTRGKREAVAVAHYSRRLIPAHAGKTRCLHPWTRTGTAHPRSRGENGLARLGGGGMRGSSPLTRGKPFLRPRTRTPTRLIPAHAGKTKRGRGRCDQTAAHPRSRGENGL